MVTSEYKNAHLIKAAGCGIVLLTFFTPLLAAGQQPLYRHYDVEHGLASSSVYSAFQDSQGYLWFTTEAGVSRYDGYRFTTYTMEDGLADNEVFSMFEDSQHRFWFLSFNGKVSYLHKGKFYNSRNSPSLKALDSDSYLSCILEDKKATSG